MMLVYFGYTSCPDQCPTTLATLTQALDQLQPAERSQIAVLFITVDQARATPQKMAEYVTAFSPDLIGLSGSPEQIADVLKAYRIYARKVDLGDGTYGMEHSSILYLMGRDGRYVDHLDPNAPANSLADDIRKSLG
jgi:protein SCO1/2